MPSNVLSPTKAHVKRFGIYAMERRCYFTIVVACFAIVGEAAAVSLYSQDFLQQAAEPTVTQGAPATSALQVVWETRAGRDRPRVTGYELQYAEADLHSNVRKGSADAAWQSVQGDARNTWDITIRVDGFDRSIGKTHSVQDGWFTVVVSRVYPKPSPLPDLRIVTEEINWDDSWSQAETKINNAMRESKHKQYSDWTVSVVRCDETEQRHHDHWAGGCPFLEYGGYTWHIRVNPPHGTIPGEDDFPTLIVGKEVVTAKWSGQGDQVLATRYGFASGADNAVWPEGTVQSPGDVDLLDPFFCQGGICVKLITGLREGTFYLVRLRAWNRNGFGPWVLPSSLHPAGDGTAYPVRTAAKLIPPSPKAPRLSSKSSNSLTVFTDAIVTENAAGVVVQAYNFEIQAYDTTGDTSLWTPVVTADASTISEGTTEATSQANKRQPMASAKGLRPSTKYRFKVSASNSEGTSDFSDISEVFTTAPGLPARSPSAPAVDASTITSSEMTVVWSSWLSRNDELSEEEEEVFEVTPSWWTKIASGSRWRTTHHLGKLNNIALSHTDRDGKWQATASGLRGYSRHRFRVRAVNSVGKGEWSEENEWTRTAAEFSRVWPEESESATFAKDVSLVISLSGEEDMPANSRDFDYYHGSGTGGVGLERGGDGVAVIIAGVPGIQLPMKTVIFYSGSTQLYAVPNHPGVDSVILKLWGAGGGGVVTPGDGFADNRTANSTQASAIAGGGGGFLQAQVTVTPGETLQILVGGGGQPAVEESGGEGGFNGGQAGGSGSASAGGGGGGTSVLRNGSKQLVAVAGGGGGAGNADTCCAFGGAGGGERGGDGGSPGFAALASLSSSREGYKDVCHGGWCSRDGSQDTIVGLTTEELSITTGGFGGTQIQGGRQGNSASLALIGNGGGRQGAVTSPRVTGSDKVSMPTVFGTRRSRTATQGGVMSGGVGADGLKAGGGGGGGFYGGGGGGSGNNGGGGGGGSSYVDISALVTANQNIAASAVGRGIDVRISAVGDSWVELEWLRQDESDRGQEAVWYQVELSRGSGSEDFAVVAKVDALDAYNPAVTTNAPRIAAGGPPATFSTILAGLSPESEYNFRVSTITRSGPGKPSKAVRLSTLPSSVNSWEKVAPRAARLERGGGRLASGVVGRPHFGELDSYQDSGALSDPPTVVRQVFPAARSGHSLVVVNDKVYLFGGRAKSGKCASPVVASSALGETPGGAAIDDCMGGNGFSAELWQFDPLTNIWFELLVGEPSPQAREGHSASVVGSKMIVFGGQGRSTTSTRMSPAGQGGTSYFGDEWEIDLDPTRRVVASTNTSTTIPEGTMVYSRITVDQSEHSGMCVSDISVSLDIGHPCTGQLRLTLFGPGPSDRDPRQYQGGGATSRSDPAVLFAGHNGTDSGSGTPVYEGCGNGIGPELRLSDAADEGVWECCGKGSPFKGHYRPFDRLLVGKFASVPAAGQWTLGMLDSTPDGLNGTVREWSLDIEMRPCDRLSSLRWINVTGNSTAGGGRPCPEPRARHAAVAVSGDVFISGGRGSIGALSDIWRRGGLITPGSSASTWVLLATGAHTTLASTGQRNTYGAAVMVSPWGILSVGGMARGHGVNFGSEVWVLDPVSERWQAVDVRGGQGVDKVPVGRYHSATVVLPASEIISGAERGPGVLLFGGKDDWRRLNDLWILRLNSVSVSSSRPRSRDTTNSQDGTGYLSQLRPNSIGSWLAAQIGKDERCLHLLVGGTANDTWHATCGLGADGGRDDNCNMAKVVERAWCLGEYQWIGSP